MMVGGFLALAALTIGLFAWLKADISGLRQEIGGLREAFEAAGLYAEAHPLRGEPGGGLRHRHRSRQTSLHSWHEMPYLQG